MSLTKAFAKSVFINCPFDVAYQSIFAATVFAVHRAGFFARSALESLDSSRTRLHTIVQLIAACRYGVHDLSRTELDERHGLPRFNMPFELGVFLGCQQYGNARQRTKSLLVLDTEQHRYQQFLSDIAGQDILAHGNDPKLAIRRIRDRLRTTSGHQGIVGGEQMWRDFIQFQADLPRICLELRLQPQELTFVDYRDVITLWQGRRDPARRIERL
jgi:hypothetical protein